MAEGVYPLAQPPDQTVNKPKRPGLSVWEGVNWAFAIYHLTGRVSWSSRHKWQGVCCHWCWWWPRQTSTRWDITSPPHNTVEPVWINPILPDNLPHDPAAQKSIDDTSLFPSFADLPVGNGRSSRLEIFVIILFFVFFIIIPSQLALRNSNSKHYG